MKNDTSTPKVPSTREESLDLIIHQFLDSDESQIRLVLYPEEIPKLEEKHKDIVVHYKNVYHPDHDLSIFLVSKRKDLQNSIIKISI